MTLGDMGAEVIKVEKPGMKCGVLMMCMIIVAIESVAFLSQITYCRCHYK